MAYLSSTATDPLVNTLPSETSLLLSHDASSVSSTRTSHWGCWKVAYLYALFILIINFGSALRFAPEIRLMELAICRRYYLQHDPSSVDHSGLVPEALCKLDEIQKQLAMLRAWLNVFVSIAGIYRRFTPWWDGRCQGPQTGNSPEFIQHYTFQNVDHLSLLACLPPPSSYVRKSHI